jgi:small subunit ribosomal protein S10
MGFCLSMFSTRCMPFVTKLTLESGDHQRLEDVVTTIKETAARKGVELKGAPPPPPPAKRGPQSIEIVGHDEFARSVAERDFPDGVHVSAEIEQRRQMN